MPDSDPEDATTAPLGLVVGNWVPSGSSGYENYSVRIPPEAERPSISTVTFRFAVGEGSDRYGVRFDRVSLRPV